MNRLITSLCLVAIAAADSGAQPSSSDRDATDAAMSVVATRNHDMRAFDEPFRPEEDYVVCNPTGPLHARRVEGRRWLAYRDRTEYGDRSPIGTEQVSAANSCGI